VDVHVVEAELSDSDGTVCSPAKRLSKLGKQGK
jgi:hypothetical protein